MYIVEGNYVATDSTTKINGVITEISISANTAKSPNSTLRKKTDLLKTVTLKYTL